MEVALVGSVTSDGGTLDIGLSMPTGLGGPGGPGTNRSSCSPLDAACFGSAIGHIARVQKLQTGPVAVTARVSIGPVAGVFEQAEALVKAAHEVRPYSNARRGNIVVDVRVA